MEQLVAFMLFKILDPLIDSEVYSQCRYSISLHNNLWEGKQERAGLIKRINDLKNYIYCKYSCPGCWGFPQTHTKFYLPFVGGNERLVWAADFIPVTPQTVSVCLRFLASDLFITLTFCTLPGFDLCGPDSCPK